METVSGKRFRVAGMATLLYALLFGICLYKNMTGIMTAVLSVGTVAYILYCSEKMKGCGSTFTSWNEDAAKVSFGTKAGEWRMYPYYAGIILLGISVCCTADLFLISVDYVGIVLLVFFALLRIFCKEEDWGFGKYAVCVLSAIFLPFRNFFANLIRDYREWRKEEKKSINPTVKYILIGALSAVPALLIVIGLLSSADMVFSGLVEKVFGEFELSFDTIGFLLLVAAVFFYVYGIAVKLPAQSLNGKVKDPEKLEPVIGITFSGILTFVYLVFSLIQILYLFHNSFSLPGGYTYAQYARQGFFQLLFVAFLNLLIVLSCIGFFRKQKVLDLVLTVMSACTYIMIASSFVRMLLYIKSYDLTYLRVLVLLGLLVFAVLFVGVIIKIYRVNFPLVHYTMLVCGIIWICFSFCHPAKLIAKYNIESGLSADLNKSREEWMEEGFRLDVSYLCSLGDDAAPEIYDLGIKLSGERYNDLPFADAALDVIKLHFRIISLDWEEQDDIRGFNFSRYRANLYAERYLDHCAD